MEIQRIREAVRQAERGFSVIRSALRGEQTEEEIANQLEYQMRPFWRKIVRIYQYRRRWSQSGTSSRDAFRPASRIPADLLLIDWGGK